MVEEYGDSILEELQQFVLDEIESYRYRVSKGALGRPFTDEEIQRRLAEMRALLVEPEWRVVVMDDTADGAQLETPEHRRCILVADDPDTHEMYYDPQEEPFFLAHDNPPRTLGVWGDAVGYFLAR